MALHSETLLEYAKDQGWRDQPWLHLIAEFDAITPTPCPCATHPDRKWEVTSAHHKAIRRADVATATAMVDRMKSIGDWKYWTHRLCVIACEDMGPAAPDLVLFLCAFYGVFTPSKLSESEAYDSVWKFTVMLCRHPTRSRAWCSLLLMEQHLKYSPDSSLSWVAHLAKASAIADPALHDWCTKGKWRGDGMLRYRGLNLPFEFTKVDFVDRRYPSKTIAGLPGYAYDLHTRVGKKAIGLLLQVPSLKKVVGALPPIKRTMDLGGLKELVGWAMFYCETSVIRNELVDIELRQAEEEIVRAAYGLSAVEWVKLMTVMIELRDAGRFQTARELVLARN
jgi:hypothetical protein